ncbi:DEAD/DEAH box helicase family protein [Roseibium sp. M-1]
MKDLKFKISWRSYQQRVLDELDGHLDDAQLHVVAAPGSGKTVLGLEVMRRLGRPAIVFAPSLAIRNQWRTRLLELFLPEKADHSWISMDIRRPGQVTIVTYQGFHAALSGDLKEDGACQGAGQGGAEGLAILKRIKEQNVGTLVFDEAHHLRKEWHQVLLKLREFLPGDVHTVSLTATPPYDTDASEWDNYETLCGPIDCEISVPELVATGDLCPHQDLVCFSAPTEKETAFIDAFAHNLNAFAYDLLHDDAFLTSLAELPWFTVPRFHEDQIFRNPAFVLAAQVFLKAAGRAGHPEILALFNLEADASPPLDRTFLENVLEGVLAGEARDWFQPDLRRQLQGKLRSFGGLKGSRPVIANLESIDRLLRNSLGKIESIRKIVAAESSGLGDALRMVILTDHIHRELTSSSGQAVYEPVKIGAVPLFEVLRKKGMYRYEVGLLTGSLVILPRGAIASFQEAAAAKGIGAKDIRLRPLPHDAAYFEVDLAASARHEMVHLVTEVFSSGAVSVLVGTQSLLGEGWDAPCINSLVLASTVGSFMLSNQMRGRAIRKDPEQPCKTANIWHLACVSLPERRELLANLPIAEQAHSGLRRAGLLPAPAWEDLGQDAALLTRRFRAFEGLGVTEPPVIETGLARMGFAQADWSTDGIERLNGAAFARSADRNLLADSWKAALLKSPSTARLRPMVKAQRVPQGWVYRRTALSLGLAAASGLVPLAGFFWGLWAASLPVIGVSAALATAFVLGVRKSRLLKSAAGLLRNRTVDRNLLQVARAVLETLAQTRQLQTPLDQLTPEVVRHDGGYLCTLEGARPKETALFLTALSQLLGPVDNPKYLLVRRSRFLGRTQIDYHPVPEAFSAQKADARMFLAYWEALVSEADLVSMRSQEGRKILLQARAAAYSKQAVPSSERLGRWQ